MANQMEAAYPRKIIYSVEILIEKDPGNSNRPRFEKATYEKRSSDGKGGWRTTARLATYEVAAAKLSLIELYEQLQGEYAIAQVPRKKKSTKSNRNDERARDASI